MLSENITLKLKQYIETALDAVVCEMHEAPYNIEARSATYDALDEFVIDNQQPNFKEVLFHFIDRGEMTDATVYKKAWMDRRLFSKTRSNPDYQIGKDSAITLALALELSENDAEELLQAAGFALSDSDKRDLVIQFCLKNEIYNLLDVNEALDVMEVKALGTEK